MFARGRRISDGSSLSTSRKPSPLPKREGEIDGVVKRAMGAVSGLLGGRRRQNSLRGTYNAVGGHEQ